VHAEYRKLEYRTYFSCGRGAATRHPHTTFSARRKRCGVEALSMSLSRPACSVRIAVKEPQGKRQDVGSSLHEPRSCRSARLHTKPGSKGMASEQRVRHNSVGMARRRGSCRGCWYISTNAKAWTTRIEKVCTCEHEHEHDMQMHMCMHMCMCMSHVHALAPSCTWL
jgi:hypothetical protein